MIRYLLDTNIISEPARPDPSERVLEQLAAHSEELALPSIVWHELTYGARRMDEGRRRSYVLDYLGEVVRPAMPIIPYDTAAAQWHGEQRAALEAQGLTRPFADGQIAAIAATRDLIVVTRNTSDFAHYEDLHVENWFLS
jgi:tRNA(fMet)-specific endonuclease VapC